MGSIPLTPPLCQRETYKASFFMLISLVFLAVLKEAVSGVLTCIFPGVFKCVLGSYVCFFKGANSTL